MWNCCGTCQYYGEWGDGYCSMRDSRMEPENDACYMYQEWQGDIEDEREEEE